MHDAIKGWVLYDLVVEAAQLVLDRRVQAPGEGVYRRSRTCATGGGGSGGLGGTLGNPGRLSGSTLGAFAHGACPAGTMRYAAARCGLKASIGVVESRAQTATEDEEEEGELR